ncbi:putative mitochondrial protein [Vitis vinifera]|uniref:Putative mitochondrial protein n=1 Tax=Vitis vinifera TaxID=29760 RepID=A0A438E6Y1_VITVI|nr:putative mitochondrial protein [Vitis vinifera]
MWGKEGSFLDRCLVGSWGETEMTDADLRDMEKWGKQHWKLQGEMRIARIGGCCCLIVFEFKAEANNVLQRGFRRFKESVIQLKRWDPSVGCSQRREQAKEVWVRVMGLPLHLWNREVFKKIGDSCGGFIAVDESTGALKELQWARILVKVEGMGGPSSLQVVIGNTCYAIQLWWEMLPRVTDVIPADSYGKGKKMEVREEEGGKTRAGGAVERVQAKGHPVKLAVPSEDGESSCIPALATVSDMMQAGGVAAERLKDGGEYLQKEGTAIKTKDGSGWVLDSEVEIRPSMETQVVIKEVSGLDLLGPHAKKTKLKVQKGPTEEDHPEVCGLPLLGPIPSSSGSVMGCAQVDPYKGSTGIGHPITYPTVPVGARAREACRKEADGWTDGVLVGASQGSSFPDCNFKELTDEALKEEAARYTSSCTRDVFSFGERALYSSSSSRSGWGGMLVDPVEGSDVGGIDMDPLRMIMADGREAKVLGSPGMVLGTVGKEAEKVVGWDITEERGEQCWQSSCLARFSRCLEMPTEGFEGEIPLLLKRMKERKFQKGKKGNQDGRKKRKMESSKFERELRKLEWTETKIQEMTREIIRSIGVGRFLDWGTVDSRGSAGGIVVLWDNREFYGPTKRRERENLWNELGAIHGLWNGPWCVAGDFNAILSPEERSRGGSFNSDMRRFAEVIEELQLKDLTLFGGPFTWSGGVNNQTMSRLDRFLVNEGWDCRFSHSRQSVLPRPVSDHFPILLEGGGLRNGPSPFRFENMWLKVEGFKDLLKAWWEGDNFNGAASYVLAEKLKVVKTKLKEWNRDVFGRVEYRKNVALEQMQFWDAKEKISRLTVEEMEARREAREEYKKWVLLEEVTWRQKSREVWLKEGDRNTNFFHRMANAHRRRNNMERIRINGVWKSEENGMSEGIVNAFKTLLSNPGDWRPSLAGLQCEQLQRLDADALEVPFTEEEVHDALVGCSGDKAPGPDGFTMSFWQFAWDFVKEDVMRFFREFHEHGWIKWCISTASFSVLVNGTPKGFFQSSRGLRQGDPLSPYLFVIAMEVFSSFLNRAVDNGYISGCQVKGRNEGGIQISHLLFADDTLVFCQASQDQLTYLSWLLMWFEAVSGMRINLDKSELIPVGRVVDIDDLALDFDVKWVVSRPRIWVFLWALRSSQWQCGTEWKSGFAKD